MKKALFAAMALVVTMSQFGCDLGGLGGRWNVLALDVIEVLDIFNVVAGAPGLN
jgi:hypothetical protein